MKLHEIKREEFAVLVALHHMKPSEAARSIGFTRQYASQLMRIEEVAYRIRELEDSVASSKIMTEIEAMEILSDIARANLVDFLDGKEPKLDKSIPHHAAVLEYYHRTRYDGKGKPVVTKSIKLDNRRAAIELLADLRGWKKQEENGKDTAIDIIAGVLSKLRGYQAPKELTEGAGPEVKDGETINYGPGGKGANTYGPAPEDIEGETIILPVSEGPEDHD